MKLLHPLLKKAAAAEGAKERGGSSVVNISSIASVSAVKTGTVYGIVRYCGDAVGSCYAFRACFGFSPLLRDCRCIRMAVSLCEQTMMGLADSHGGTQPLIVLADR